MAPRGVEVGGLPLTFQTTPTTSSTGSAARDLQRYYGGALDDEEQWLVSSRLKLSIEKTKLLWIGTGAQLRRLPPDIPSLRVSSTNIEGAEETRIVGLTTTPDLSLSLS